MPGMRNSRIQVDRLLKAISLVEEVREVCILEGDPYYFLVSSCELELSMQVVGVSTRGCPPTTPIG